MEISLQGPGAESQWWFGAEPPEARYAYTICSGQTYFRDVFIEDNTVYVQAHAESATPLLLQQTLNLCKSHDPPWPR